MQRIGLTTAFAATGAAMIALFSAAMALLLSNFIESRLLLRDAAISRDFVQSIVTIQKVEGAFSKPDPVHDPDFAEFLAHLAAMPDVLRTNVYGTDRRVLWSTRPEMIGRSFPDNDELDEALRGAAVVHIDHDAHDNKSEHMLLGARADEFIENYLPVFDARRQRVLAVVELYRRPVALFEAIRSGKQRVWLAAAAGGLLLFVSLWWFVRRIERALREQQSRLVEAEAMAMVGEISAAVAHSIRNPLGSIRSSAELERELNGDAQGTSADVIRNVDRIEHLVRTMLTYVGEGGDRFASTDVAQALRDGCERFRPELKAQGKTLEVDIEAGLGAAPADPVLLAQVINSLLSNALEATRQGDTVSVRAASEGPWMRVDVRDTGVGIAPERLPHVFDPFATNKPRGLGLGLALVRRFATRCGGRVAIESRPGQGTCLSLWLPRQLA